MLVLILYDIVLNSIYVTLNLFQSVLNQMSGWYWWEMRRLTLQWEGQEAMLSNSLVRQLHLAIGQTAFAAVHHFLCETTL